MGSLFFHGVNMSIAAGVTALLVMLLRVTLGKKLPKQFSFALWFIVFVKMALPVSFSSVFSLWGLFDSYGIGKSGEALSSFYQGMPKQEGLLGFSGENGGATGVIQEKGATETFSFQGAEGNAFFLIHLVITLCIILWLIGIAFFLVRAALSYRSLTEKIRTAVLWNDGGIIETCRKTIGLRRRVRVFQSEFADSPFVIGIFDVKVILPSSLIEVGGTKMRSVLLHEFYHIKRADMLVKPLFYLLSCLHWFNPILWLAFRLFEKDMEMSCDERVVGTMRDSDKRGYADTLLGMAVERSGGWKTGGLSFNESSVGERVKNIIKYKKPTIGIVAVCIVIVAVLAFGLLSQPKAQMLDKGLRGTSNVLVLCNEKSSSIADTILLLGFEQGTGKINILQLPRDTFIGTNDGTTGITMNKLGYFAAKHNPQETMKAVGDLLGVDVEHYMKIDTEDLKTIVDDLGGVEYDVPMDMHYEDPNQNLKIDLKKGKQTLDGKQAEMLLRYRHGYVNGDLDRLSVQKDFLQAVFKQKGSQLKRFLTSNKAAELMKNLKTNLTTSDMIGLARTFMNGKWQPENIQFVEIPYKEESESPYGINMVMLDKEQAERLCKGKF